MQDLEAEGVIFVTSGKKTASLWKLQPQSEVSAAVERLQVTLKRLQADHQKMLTAQEQLAKQIYASLIELRQLRSRLP
jgi:hypothetical protein